MAFIGEPWVTATRGAGRAARVASPTAAREARENREEETGMEMTGEQYIPLPQQKVWEALNDPEILKACITGCDAFERVGENEFRMGMVAVVGPVKARFNGKLLLSDVIPPHSYAMAFEGSGGGAGFGKGGAKVSLLPEGDGTKLRYTAQATVGGKLAQVGSRLIDGVAKKMTDDFFAKFVATVAPAPVAVREGAPPILEAPKPAEPAFNPIWIVVAIILAQVVLYFLLGGGR
jgi:carbon monoxide dehydrogenase subunit G